MRQKKMQKKQTKTKQSKMQMRIEKCNLPLKKVISNMGWLTKIGYEAWIEGRGNGEVTIIFEKKTKSVGGR